ncbi:hypothetical protein OXB_1124 [Bacillus sp. OxB-1]|uniref:hypothetical protein n=1 Tax=Bacillus sp. (strain OxB-1) TaxID=98228 RepID=UPI000581DA26|nr:hypothetical protein [Bacillus sp. OxB-1]BAQ09596.1 hypothetical protein OXB_1124 [Bacillus sp. OxB-1]
MKMRSFLTFIIATAFVIIFFTLLTDPGAKLIQGVQDRFPVKKEITQLIEGMEEKTDVRRDEGTVADYVIYLDVTRYQMNKESDSDKITPIEPLPDHYPAVFLEVKHLVNKTPEQLAKQSQMDLESELPDIGPIPVETITSPVEGYGLHGVAGNEWDSKIIDIYIVPDGKEGSFLITANYFLEAAEGHGSRFYHMLESFEVIERR